MGLSELSLQIPYSLGPTWKGPRVDLLGSEAVGPPVSEINFYPGSRLDRVDPRVQFLQGTVVSTYPPLHADYPYSLPVVLMVVTSDPQTLRTQEDPTEGVWVSDTLNPGSGLTPESSGLTLDTSGVTES